MCAWQLDPLSLFQQSALHLRLYYHILSWYYNDIHLGSLSKEQWDLFISCGILWESQFQTLIGPMPMAPINTPLFLATMMMSMVGSGQCWILPVLALHYITQNYITLAWHLLHYCYCVLEASNAINKHAGDCWL